ncbi:rho GTPase-activating protein 2-like [Senna tora]|uniref:Rho GTPase-activating protein 2-like n=1 Tax=Senna tora TaxID=362788 RepID=A0A834XGW2_9FABA|nr:rho GTPase-activating protein 2-like [Senna tora]
MVDRQDNVISTVHHMEIGWPTNVQHITHVTFDRFNGFLVLPVEFEVEILGRFRCELIKVLQKLKEGTRLVTAFSNEILDQNRVSSQNNFLNIALPRQLETQKDTPNFSKKNGSLPELLTKTKKPAAIILSDHATTN